MSNSSKSEQTTKRELTADELNQVTGGMGPVLIFRQAAPEVPVRDNSITIWKHFDKATP